MELSKKQGQAPCSPLMLFYGHTVANAFPIHGNGERFLCDMRFRDTLSGSPETAGCISWWSEGHVSNPLLFMTILISVLKGIQRVLYRLYSYAAHPTVPGSIYIVIIILRRFCRGIDRIIYRDFRDEGTYVFSYCMYCFG